MLNVIDALLDIACSKAVDCGGVVLLLYLTTTTDSKNFGIFIATEIRMTGTTYLNSRCLKERCFSQQFVPDPFLYEPLNQYIMSVLLGNDTTLTCRLLDC